MAAGHVLAEERELGVARLVALNPAVLEAEIRSRPDDGGVGGAVAGQPVVLPRDAALCDGEFVTLESSVGRIASQFLVPYPPGIPVFVPGLRITEAMVALVKGVIETEGVAAVHGLFCRGGHAPYYVEVLNRDEGKRLECDIAPLR